MLRLFPIVKQAIVQLPLTHIQGGDNNSQTEVAIQTSQATKNPIEEQKGKSLVLESTTNNNEDLEGWTTVTRKKKKRFSQGSQHRSNQQSLLSIHAKKLRQQRKCFKCLREGHI